MKESTESAPYTNGGEMDKFYQKFRRWLLAAALIAAALLVLGCAENVDGTAAPRERSSASESMADQTAGQEKGQKLQSDRKEQTDRELRAAQELQEVRESQADQGLQPDGEKPEKEQQEKQDRDEADEPGGDSGKGQSGKAEELAVSEDGEYTQKDEVALYLHEYGHLPGNYITKKDAQDLGWDNKKGNLDEVAPGKSIGGSHFGNYEGMLPEKKGRKYYECDLEYEGGYRGAKRLIYSNDGLIFYTEDHYQTFEQLYSGK